MAGVGVRVGVRAEWAPLPDVGVSHSFDLEIDLPPPEGRPQARWYRGNPLGGRGLQKPWPWLQPSESIPVNEVLVLYACLAPPQPGNLWHDLTSTSPVACHGRSHTTVCVSISFASAPFKLAARFGLLLFSFTLLCHMVVPSFSRSEIQQRV